MGVQWKFVGIAIALFAFAAFAFKRPELFLHGRRSHFWVKMIGRERTITMVRFVSVPILVFVGVCLLLGGLGIVHLR